MQKQPKSMELSEFREYHQDRSRRKMEDYTIGFSTTQMTGGYFSDAIDLLGQKVFADTQDYKQRFGDAQALTAEISQLEHPDHLRLHFQQLLRTWKIGTAVSSSPEQIRSHPSYKALRSLGEAVLPLIFAQYEREVGEWAMLLRDITGTDPASGTQKGDIYSTRDAWLTWARTEGYLPQEKK